MSAGREGKAAWRQVGVSIRSDIYDEAERQRLDISMECNAALARTLGMDSPASLPSTPGATAPAAVSTLPAVATAPLRPVINADDPATPAKVKKEKKEAATVKPRPVPPPAAPNVPPSQKTVTPIAPTLSSEGAPKKLEADRKKRAGAIKKFVTSRIVRCDDEGGTDTVIPKDELYQRFERWCREHAVHPVPDRRSFTVALKNQFAIPERSIGGEPYWVNVRLR